LAESICSFPSRVNKNQFPEEESNAQATEQADAATQSAANGYSFERGYPSGDIAQKAYDDADLNRAVEVYRFFYPTVSGHAIFKGNERIGIVPNKVFGTLDSKPMHVGFTYNSDTPYAPLLMDLSDGPMVIELPPGPLICIAMDVNQLWIADLGLPGPSAGNGDKVVFLPPGYKDKPPAGYRVASSPSNTMLVGIRSLPVGGDGSCSSSRFGPARLSTSLPSLRTACMSLGSRHPAASAKVRRVHRQNWMLFSQASGVVSCCRGLRSSHLVSGQPGVDLTE